VSIEPVCDELADRRALRQKSHRWTRWRQAQVKLHPEMRSRAILVLDDVVRFANNDTGTAWRHLGDICAATHLSERTVQRGIDDLEKAGLVRTPNRRRGRQRIDFELVEDVAEDRAEKRQPDVSVVAEKRQPDVTVAALTGEGLRKRTDPPKPPKGGRSRDRESWRADLDDWIVAEDLPSEHAGRVALVVRRAVDAGQRPDRAFIVERLEQMTAWRDGRAPTDADTPAAVDGPEQLAFDAEATP
jgi:DNA-binding transcriptional ArsR family regulator